MMVMLILIEKTRPVVAACKIHCALAPSEAETHICQRRKLDPTQLPIAVEIINLRDLLESNIFAGG
jgi:hypothetical protein